MRHSNGIGPAGPDPAYTISLLIDVVFRFLSARKKSRKIMFGVCHTSPDSQQGYT